MGRLPWIRQREAALDRTHDEINDVRRTHMQIAAQRQSTEYDNRVRNAAAVSTIVCGRYGAMLQGEAIVKLLDSSPAR